MNRILIAALAGAVTACSVTPGSERPRARNVLTAAEISEVHALTAFEAIQRLRPEFLRRGRINMREDTREFPIVYVDDLRVGDVGELRYIRASEVARIEYLSGSDATMRYGTGHTGGALLVTTKGAGGGT